MKRLVYKVAAIPAGGLHVKETLDSLWMKQASSFNDVDAYTPKGEVSVEADITVERRRVRIAGRSSADWEAACSRCLETLEIHTEVDLAELLLPVDEVADRKGGVMDLTPEDFETALYERGEIDLGNHLVQRHLLALPMVPRCDDECSALTFHEPDLDETETMNETKPQNPKWLAGLASARNKIGK